MGSSYLSRIAQPITAGERPLVSRPLPSLEDTQAPGVIRSASEARKMPDPEEPNPREPASRVAREPASPRRARAATAILADPTAPAPPDQAIGRPAAPALQGEGLVPTASAGGANTPRVRTAGDRGSAPSAPASISTPIEREATPRSAPPTAFAAFRVEAWASPLSGGPHAGASMPPDEPRVPLEPPGPVAAAPSRPAARIHIGTVEVRTMGGHAAIAAPVPAAAPAPVRAAMRSEAAAPATLARPLHHRYGLIQS